MITDRHGKTQVYCYRGRQAKSCNQPSVMPGAVAEQLAAYLAERDRLQDRPTGLRGATEWARAMTRAAGFRRDLPAALAAATLEHSRHSLHLPRSTERGGSMWPPRTVKSCLYAAEATGVESAPSEPAGCATPGSGHGLSHESFT